MKSIHISGHRPITIGIFLALALLATVGCTSYSKLAKDPDSNVRMQAAASAVSKKLLTLLANDPESRVRIQVANNTNSSAKRLAQLASDPDPEVRRSVAVNIATSKETLNQLAKDPDIRVRATAETSRDILIYLESRSWLFSKFL